LDDDVIEASEAAARERGLSLSRYVNGELRAAGGSRWPAGFFDLFGGIDDDGFSRPDQPSFSSDGPRAQL
jgi:hypothetical protein